MSLDNLNECSSCKEHTAALLWAKLYGSLDHADCEGSGVMEVFSVLLPKPMAIKVEVCFACGSFKAVPHGQYSEEDIKALEKRNAESQRQTKIGEQFGHLFGLGKKPE